MVGLGAPLLVLLVLLALFLPAQQAGDPKQPQRPQQRYGAPPPPATQPAALPKLELGPANCVDMFGAGVSGGGTNGSGALFDEQEAAGDPSRAQGASILKSTYMPGWTLWMYPDAGDPAANGGVQALVDLQTPHAVSDIWLNHHSGYVQAALEIFATSPFDARPVWRAAINTTHDKAGSPVAPPPVCSGWGWNQRWCGWNISKTEAASPKGRYIVLSLLQPEELFEMVVYGKALGPPPAPPPPGPPPPPPPLMGDFVGVNSFVVEPLARQNAAGWIREYHDWQ